MSDKEEKHSIQKTDDFLEKQPEKKFKMDFKNNPFEKYQHKFSTSLATLFLGMILVIIGFILLGYSEGAIQEANSVKSLPLLEVGTLHRTEGLMKITGYPIPACEITVAACAENLIYFKKIREEEIDGKYIPIREDDSWANFKLGSVTIIPSKARLLFNLKELSRVEGEEEKNGTIIKYREITVGVTDQEKLIVIGQLKQNTIDSGSIFIITNKNNSGLVNYLKEGTTFNWWIFKISAFLLLTLGIAAFILPVLVFLDIFPKIGLGLTTIFFLLSALVAFVFVFLSTIVLTYWWLIFVFVGVVIVLLIRIKAKKKNVLNFIP